MKQSTEKNTTTPTLLFEQKKKKREKISSFSDRNYRNKYHYRRIYHFYSVQIPEGASVLQINCKNDFVLDAVKPFLGMGIDENEERIKKAQSRFPEYEFIQTSLRNFSIQHTFDYILLSTSINEVDDIQHFLSELHRFCHSGTRIIIETYSYLWSPILWFTQKIGLRSKTVYKNKISLFDLHNFAYLAGFDVVTTGRHTLFPFYIPFFSSFFNSCIARLPLINRLCLHNWVIIRPIKIKKASEVSVSIVIPCRNEAGNIEPAVTRCPILGKKTEIIFVEGNSQDNTLDEIKRVAKKYPEKNVSYFVQEGKGKGDAVRMGFKHAHGDVLMIQDGDLTAQPEELPKFFDAIVSGKGEFINGSRLVYGMESRAMMFLAFIANHFFGRLLSWIIGQRIKDSLCGTKVLWKKDYEKIAQNRDYFGLHDPFGDFDLLFGAARLNLKIIDMPVHYKDRAYGKTNIRRFWDVWFLLWMCLRATWFLKLL